MNAATATAAVNVNLTDKAKTILNVIAHGATSRDEIAESMGVSVPVVNGSLTALKRNGLIELDPTSGAVSITPDARPYLDPPKMKQDIPTVEGKHHRPGSKMEQAREVFSQFVNDGRQAVLEQFRTSIGLTPAGAATYYQTLRHETGAAAFQKGKPPATAAPPAQKTAVKRKR